ASGSASTLSGYSDTGSISDYAFQAVATLVKTNIITGSNGVLNPRGVIGRAEMAVILYRILTM
ncbi:MAG: S-layer homology domain-containing protein, partial [Clostridia bacterium]|nr:S-layer homology domain-containing protein [Clostridia bacterium]